MASDRILAWDGCNNVRDLGGLDTLTGHKTRWGAVVRSDHPSKLTTKGWSALYEYGIRTIISLRTHGMPEKHPDVVAPQPEIDTVVMEIEDVTDKEFALQWASSDLWSTPLYYRDALNRWPQRHAAALKAIAQAKPGGVLFHCVRGHDRTGIIALLLLALVGVPPEEILADYELSVDPVRENLLVEQNTTTREIILSTLASLDEESYLSEGGFTQDDLSAIRARFIESK